MAVDEAAAHRVAGRAALPHNPRRGARRGLPKFLLAFCGLVLATQLLAPVGMGQPAACVTTPSRGRAASTLPGAGENYVRSGAVTRQTSDSGDTLSFAEAKGPFSLGGGAVRIPLRPVSPSALEDGLLISRLDKLKGGRSIYLVVRGLHAEEQPGVLYNIYLDLPAGAKPRKDDPHYVGQLNFFNSAYAGSASGSDFFFSYDLTSVARNLRGRKLLGARTVITISPAGTPENGAAPSIGRVELLEQ
jgi:hypothetical protein